MEKRNGTAVKEFWRFVKFGLFSASAGLIETGIFYLLGLFSSFGYWVCYLPALVASVVWNFTLNRRFTFHSDADVPAAMAKVFAYYAVFTPLSTILGNYLAEVRFAAYPAADDIVFFATLLVNFITEFLYQRYYVFRGKIDSRETRAPGRSDHEGGPPSSR
ncbi:MAG TPA: GtrA family protein [Oscillospiraceae bacterium]|nr:GtrA family protein [Oscillospiraceae bacterium]